MEFEVLKYLLGAYGRLVKITDISEMLVSSVTNIESAIKNLKTNGYDVFDDSLGNVRLNKFTDVLDLASLKLMFGMTGDSVPIAFFKEANSTNVKAKELFEQGFFGVVVAETQTTGRGRRGRNFLSTNDGIYFSYVMPVKNLKVEEMLKMVFLSGVGVCDTLREMNINAVLKWPNDVYVGSKKICGILCEAVMGDNGISSVILGIGINVNNTSFDNTINNIATSIFLETGEHSLRSEIIAKVVKNIDAYDVFKNGFDDVLCKYRKYSNTIGKDIFVIDENEKYEAQAIDIDEMGLLVIRRKEGGNKKVISADVSIRGDF